MISVLQFQLYFLVLIRIVSFIVMSPLFFIKNIPSMVKVGFSLFLTILVYKLIPTNHITEEIHLVMFFIFTLRELIFGLALGFITQLLFMSIRMAGQLTDAQAGFAMASIYDPMSQNNVTLYGRMYYWLGLMLFFIINGHHYLIYAIISTFDFVPIGTISIEDFNIMGITSLFSRTFIAAVQIGIPIIMVIFLTDIILGIMARTVPQLNVFILGMPLKILVSLLAIVIILPGLVNLMIPVIESIPYFLDKLLN